ncbi:MAG: hypothetical protein GX053_14505 [Tissierella sp.]|nr:hypothetical protein [Tissierella sp.]
MRLIKKIINLFLSQVDEEHPISTQSKRDIRFESIKANVSNGVNKPIEMSEDEEMFIKELILRIDATHDNYNLSFERLSDKTFNVWYNSYYLGKIKLQGKDTYMQILYGTHGANAVRECNLNEYIKHIDSWIERIKFLDTI